MTAATGVISTVAGNGFQAGEGGGGFSGDGGGAATQVAELAQPDGVAVDAAGNLFIADSLNNRIRKVSSSGIITTFAGQFLGFAGDGGPATSASLNDPFNVAVDAAGDIFPSSPTRT